jgi:hypothetical protein
VILAEREFFWLLLREEEFQVALRAVHDQVHTIEVFLVRYYQVIKLSREYVVFHCRKLSHNLYFTENLSKVIRIFNKARYHFNGHPFLSEFVLSIDNLTEGSLAD